MQSTDVSTVDDGKSIDNMEINDDNITVDPSNDLPQKKVVCEGIEEASFEREVGNEEMEVHFVENSGSIPVVEGLVQRDSVIVEGSESFDVCGGEDSQGSLGKLPLFPKAANKDVVGQEVLTYGINGSLSVIRSVVEGNEPSSVVENQAPGDVSHTGDNATEGGPVESKAELESSVGSAAKENIGENVIEGGPLDFEDALQNQAARSDVNVGGSNNMIGVTCMANVDEEGVSVPKGDGLVEVSRGNKSKKKGKFSISDLVWGKVRSHPWWPAQIFDPDDASGQAKKHFRTRSYLVAYFGDHTFAWNDETKLKPFVPHFSQMAKQSNAEAFQDAVKCALDEAASRAEFGLSCPCIADDVCSRLKVQVINNAGIRENIRIREGRERYFAASTFEPVKFLDYLKNLAQVPSIEECARLEHVVAHAQMSAFFRWKGYYHLAEFAPLLGYVNNEADAPISAKKEDIHQLISDATLTPQVEMEEDDARPQKRKKLSGNSGNLSKKVKRLSDSTCKKSKKAASMQEDDAEDTEGKTNRKFLSSFVRCKKAKLPFSESKSKENSSQITPTRESKLGLRVGEGILRAAFQLSQPSPLLKLDVSSYAKTSKGSGKSKKHNQQTDAISFKKSSPDDILSNFLSVAVEPLKEHTFLSSMTCFFSDLRDSVVVDVAFLKKDGESESYDIVDKPKELPSGSENEEMNEDIVQKESGPQETENVAAEKRPSEEDIIQEESPTALTLKFTDTDSIPTEAKLNKIFSSFGPLKESETEVLDKKNCARVVFKRRMDAETAFSSSGKFETFGASLVCYQLNFSPSPRKSSSPETKRRRKDGKLVESIRT